jgi:hypothetical protein
VVEWAGKIWLLTLGPKEVRSSGGTLVAEIGPVPEVPTATSYVLDMNEQCLETPNGATRARAGDGMVAPANTPMQLNITGSSKRDVSLWLFTMP